MAVRDECTIKQGKDKPRWVYRTPAVVLPLAEFDHGAAILATPTRSLLVRHWVSASYGSKVLDGKILHWTGCALDPQRFEPGKVRIDDPRSSGVVYSGIIDYNKFLTLAKCGCA